MRYLVLVLLTVWFGASQAQDSSNSLQSDLLQLTLFSEDLETARVGAVSVSRMFADDQAATDLLAESLVQVSPGELSRVQMGTLHHRLNAIGDLKNPRYRSVLLRSRELVELEDYRKRVDAIVAILGTSNVTQYEAGSLDWKSRQNELEYRLASRKKADRSALKTIAPETNLVDVLQRLGAPDTVSGITQYGKWGRSATMVAHYVGTGLVALRFDAQMAQWLVFETAEQLVSVVGFYRGEQLGLANMIACFRGYAFRNVMKYYGRAILKEPEIMDLLAERIAVNSYVSDKFDDDGMRVGVQLIATSKDAKTAGRLKKIAESAGAKGARKDASRFLRRIEAQEQREMVRQNENQAASN